MKKLITIKHALILAIMLSVTAYSFESSASDTIKIGVITALSGEHAAYGTSTYRAAVLVADEYNAKGGINGKKIEIIPADDQCKSEIATSAATKLVSDNVVGVLGALCSGSTKAILPILTEAKVILISPASSTPDLTLDGKSPYFMRTIGHDYMQSEVATEFIGSELQAKKVAFLDDKSEYGSNYTKVTSQNLKKNYPHIKIALSESITTGAADYTAIIRKIGRSGADVIVWGGYYNDLAKIVNGIKEFDLDIKIVAPDSIKDNAYISTAGNASEGTFASAPTDTSANPLSISATKAHKKKFGTNPGAFFDNAYAAALALVNSIDKANSTDTDKMVNVLKNTKVPTSLGAISFDKNGDAEGIGMSMYKVEDGKFIPAFTK